MGTIDPRLQRQLYVRRTDPDAPVEGPAVGGRPRVLVRFSGDVADLERAGMHVETVAGDVAVGHVDLADVEELSQVTHVSVVEAARQLRPLIHDSVPAINADQVRTGALGLTGAGVVVGVTDTGIDIFHHAFRKPDGSTRILSMWDQMLTAIPPEAPPAGFTFTPGTGGAEFSAAAINAALTSGASTFRSTDDEGHGTHVAGIAAGNGSQSGNCHLSDYYIGVAPEADIVVVKTDGDSTNVINAAQYIFRVAHDAGKAAVMNLSMGGEAGQGPHDGTAAFETGLDALAGARTSIVVAAGNDGDNGSHAFVTIPARGLKTFTFVVPDGDNQRDDIDIWWTGGQLSMTLSAAPALTSYAPVSAGAAYGPLAFGTAGGDVVNAGGDSSGTRNRIYFDISPAAAGGSITPGNWTIALQETAGTDAVVDIWVQISGDDQDPAFIEADRDSTRTINVPGTASNVICVGAYNWRDKSLESYSSRGPRVDGVRKPDICAPGKSIFSAKSKERSVWYCCDCCLDFFINLDGTSMATPHVTGVAALIFQRNSTLTFDEVRAHIVASGQAPDETIGPTLPSNDWGSGIIDALIACSGVPPASAAAAVAAGAGPAPEAAGPEPEMAGPAAAAGPALAAEA